MNAAPHDVYVERKNRCATEAVAAGQRAERLGWARLVSFFALLTGLWIAAGMGWWFLAALATGVPLFGLLVRASARADERSRGARAAEHWYSEGLLRLEGDPAGDGPRGEAFLDAEHPYAGDLDIFGNRSLFARVCRARDARRTQDLGWVVTCARSRG